MSIHICLSLSVAELTRVVWLIARLNGGSGLVDFPSFHHSQIYAVYELCTDFPTIEDRDLP
ncbi:MAG: hypothetical protein QGI34_00865 [Candidatus Latescibacteria bacterium]|nr:hypothetical protein [Candidatus Latescibacterota bacterium]